MLRAMRFFFLMIRRPPRSTRKIIHTVYTVTADGLLLLNHGRFIRKKTIPIAEITSIRKVHSMKFGSFSVTNYLLIEYGKGKYASVLPVKEKEFMELIEKTRNLI